jgi:hypothetical protein
MACLAAVVVGCLLLSCTTTITTEVQVRDPNLAGLRYDDGGKKVEVLPAGAGEAPPAVLFEGISADGAAVRVAAARVAGQVKLECSVNCMAALPATLSKEGFLTLPGPAAQNVGAAKGEDLFSLPVSVPVTLAAGGTLQRNAGAAVGGEKPVLLKAELVTARKNLIVRERTTRAAPWMRLAGGLAALAGGILGGSGLLNDNLGAGIGGLSILVGGIGLAVAGELWGSKGSKTRQVGL